MSRHSYTRSSHVDEKPGHVLLFPPWWCELVNERIFYLNVVLLNLTVICWMDYAVTALRLVLL